MDSSRFTTLSFDCYGTLIDWESGIWDGFQPLLVTNASTMTRRKLLEKYAKIESALQAAHPDGAYPDILRTAHNQFAAENGLNTSDDMDERFGNFVPFWPAFPDSADALRRLKQKFKLVVLSNVDRAGFAASNLRLGVAFDAIYTAGDIGSYKPDPANFSFMLKKLKQDHGIDHGRILHVAQSLFHDIAPAQAASLPCVWIDRQNLRDGGSWGATPKTPAVTEPDVVFPTLMDFAEAVT